MAMEMLKSTRYLNLAKSLSIAASCLSLILPWEKRWIPFSVRPRARKILLSVDVLGICLSTIARVRGSSSSVPMGVLAVL